MSDLQSIKDEAAKAEIEPLLPVEKKLIAWSLGLGVGLLVALVVINKLFPFY